MKRFMYLSIGVLCLALSALIGFHIGNQAAQAQAPEGITGYSTKSAGGIEIQAYHHVMLSNGDVYRNVSVQSSADHLTIFRSAPEYVGNFWNGAPVPTEGTSLGGIKEKYGDKNN